MNATLPKYFIVTIATFVLIPLLFIMSSSLVRSAADHVIISEVQIAGDDADDEFVELYNPTASDVVMENWRLTRKTSTGTESNLVADIDATIPAFSYFLIAPADYDGAVVEDLSYSTSGRLAINNSVLLYSDAGTTIVDKVGMGSAADFESAATENPTANGSVRRTTNDDTDNNSVDFETLSVSDPQNTTVIQTPTASPTTSPTSTSTMSPTPSPTPTLTPTPTPSPTPTASPTASPTVSPTPSPTAVASPTVSPTPSPTPTLTPSPVSVASFFFPNTVCRMHIHYIRFGLFRMPFAMVVCERV